MKRRGDTAWSLRTVATAVVALGLVLVAFKAAQAMDILNMCKVISNQLGSGTNQQIANIVFSCPSQ